MWYASMVAAVLFAAACVDTPPSAPGDVARLTDVLEEGAGTAATWNKLVLPLLPGTIDATARDISNGGTIVGAAYTGFGFAGGIPYRWTAGAGISALPTGPSATNGVAEGISDDGRFVAGAIFPLGGLEAVRWQLNGSTATLVVLPRCSFSPWAEAVGVNNAGVVVGRVAPGIGVKWPTPTSCPVPLVALGDTLWLASAINDVGSISGSGKAGPRDYLFTKCFFPAGCWSFIDPVPGDLNVTVTDVNDGNRVVGTSFGPAGVQAFTWKSPAGTVNLGPAHGNVGPAISDKGRIVWTTPGLTGQTKLGPTTISLALQPYGVNNCGDIVGRENSRAVRYKKTSCD